MKKIAKILIAVALIVAVNLVANAENYTEGIFKYSVSGEKATIVACDDSVSGVVEIPSTLGGYPVKSIGNSAFGDCDLITCIEIPDGVTEIGTYAFEFCKGLESISLPQTLLYIGDYAFTYCTSLVSVEIPEGINQIKQYTFYQCSSLESVTIPLSVSRLDKGIFDNSSIKSIYYNGTKAQWNKVVKNSVYFYMPKNAKLYTVSDTLIGSVDYKLRCTVKAKDDTLMLVAETPNTSSVKVRFGKLPEGATVSLGKSAYITVENNVYTFKNPGVDKLSVPLTMTTADGNKKELSLEVDFGNVLRLVNTCSTFQSGTDLTVASGSPTAYLLFDIRDVSGGYIEVEDATRNLLDRYVITDKSAGAIRFYHPSYDKGSVTIVVKDANGNVVKSHEVTVIFHSGKDSDGNYIVKEYTPIHSVLRCDYEINGDTVTVHAEKDVRDVYLNFAKYQAETVTASVNDENIKKTGARSWRVHNTGESVEFDVYFDANEHGGEVVTRHIVVNF